MKEGIKTYLHFWERLWEMLISIWRKASAPMRTVFPWSRYVTVFVEGM